MALVQERLVEVEADESVVSDRRPVGVEKTFRAYDPDQVLLMAPVLQEWIPEGDLAHFVSDLVESETLDLRAIYDSYHGGRLIGPVFGMIVRWSTAMLVPCRKTLRRRFGSVV